MKQRVLFSGIVCFLLPLCAGTNSEEAVNPLFAATNQLIQFDQITADHVKEATEKILVDLQAGLNKIYEVPKKERTFANTMLAFDKVNNRLLAVFGSIYLLANTAPSDALRERCLAAVDQISRRFNGLELDEDLFKSMEAFGATAEAAKLSGYKKVFLSDQLRNFRNRGLNLPQAKRAELRKLRDELSSLEIKFNTNIAEHQDATLLTEPQMEGMDDAYKDAHRQKDGTYKIGLAYPSYRPFMTYAEDDKARETLYRKYNNRAAGVNLDLLKEVLILRKKVARLLGYKNFADHALANKMAKSSQEVMQFHEGLVKSLMPKAKQEYRTLVALKQKHLGDPSQTDVQRWQASYYGNLLLKERYNLNQREVEKYFELKDVLAGLFRITQNLMDVHFKEVVKAAVWHPDVTLYEVWEGKLLLGRFYLDLYPRDNKYGHAACFPMIPGRQASKPYQIPVAALVCNFPQPKNGNPALMNHGQVRTFFHEFGHVLHNMLSETKLASQSGTEVARDFVEAPSQIFENWTWDYKALKLFSRHHETGEVMPRELFDRIYAAKNANTGMGNLRQVYLGLLDMAYHGDYDPTSNLSTDDIANQIDARTTLFPPIEGTHFQASFGHLMGYAANYYGYLWSRVYAQDLFSVFEKNGILDVKTGHRYRKLILAPGGSAPAAELLHSFLERDPNDKAFIRSLGL